MSWDPSLQQSSLSRTTLVVHFVCSNTLSNARQCCKKNNNVIFQRIQFLSSICWFIHRLTLFLVKLLKANKVVTHIVAVIWKLFGSGDQRAFFCQPEWCQHSSTAYPSHSFLDPRRFLLWRRWNFPSIQWKVAVQRYKHNRNIYKLPTWCVSANFCIKCLPPKILLRCLYNFSVYQNLWEK